MKITKLSLSALILLFPLSVLGSCIDTNNLIELDANYERALSERSLDTLKALLHDDFVWVHNHAGNINEGKSDALNFLESVWQANPSATPGSRLQKDVTASLNDETGVVYGFTDVTRNGAIINYHFMRTYVGSDGKCMLVSNHTMQVPS